MVIEKKTPKYTKSNIKRYVNSDNGKRYNDFLNEKGYQKEVFEAKSIQEQGEELKSFYDEKKWKLNTNKKENKSRKNTLNDDKDNLITKIANSDKCDSDTKVHLIKKAMELEEKQKALATLQQDIDEISKEINAVI